MLLTADMHRDPDNIRGLISYLFPLYPSDWRKNACSMLCSK